MRENVNCKFLNMCQNIQNKFSRNDFRFVLIGLIAKIDLLIDSENNAVLFF